MLRPTSVHSVVLGLHSGNSIGFPLCCCLAGCQAAREHEAGSREAEAPAQGVLCQLAPGGSPCHEQGAGKGSQLEHSASWNECFSLESRHFGQKGFLGLECTWPQF